MKREIMSALILTLFSCNSWEKTYKKQITSLEFSGTIDTAYLDPEGKMQPVIILSNGIKYPIGNEIYKKFNHGDTLYKPSGTMKYYWIRDGDSVIFYQQYGEYDLTDNGRVRTTR